MSTLILKNVTKSFGGLEVVKGVSLSVEEKSFVALVGPSGSGKSTLLRLIAGFEAVTSGTITIGGTAMNNVPPAKRDMAMVFQSYALYPHMTVFENLAFNMRNRQFAEAETQKRVTETAVSIQIEHLLERKPAELSGGQRQRVALGRALVRDPGLFLFDEPLSNLDANLRAQVRVQLKRMHKAHPTTSIYVTHDQIEAMTLADIIVVLRDGAIEQVGSPNELYRNPKNEFVARFIGDPPMNLFSGELVREDSQSVLRLPGISLPLPDSLVEGLQDHCGNVKIGVRSENIKLGGVSGHLNCTAELNVSENLGKELLLDLSSEWGDIKVSAIDSKLPFQVGEAIEVNVDPQNLHFFCDNTGETLRVT